jgi:hypothetical protein
MVARRAHLLVGAEGKNGQSQRGGYQKIKKCRAHDMKRINHTCRERKQS